MDAGPHINVQTPGTDAVHVCRKCGWPFPNAHPSARHRRAHKKICGTLEGYKLAISNASDDERHSDEDYKTPSPKVVERTVNEKGSNAVGERSNKSEDEVFTDAAAEFSDSSGFSPGIEELLVDSKKSPSILEKVAKDDSTSNQSVKDTAITDMIQPPSSSIDHYPTKNHEVPDCTTDQVLSPLRYQDNVSSTGSVVISVPSYVEESHNNSNSASGISYLSKSEKPVDEANFGEALTENLSKVIGQDSDSKKNKDIKLDGVSEDIIIEHCTNEITDMAPKQEIMSGDDASLQSKEESTLDFNPKIPINVFYAEMGSVKHLDASFSSAQTNVGVAQATGSISSSYIVESKQLAEGSAVTSSVMPALEDKLDDRTCKSVVKEVPSHCEVSLVEPTITIDKNNQSDDVAVPAYTRLLEMEEGPNIEDESHAISNDLLNTSFPDVATGVLPEVNFMDSSSEVKVNAPTNSADVAEAGDHKKGTTESCNIVGTENSGGVIEDSIENIGKAHESSSNNSRFQINALMDSSKDNNAGCEEHLKSEKCDISEDSSLGGPVEENISVKTKCVLVYSRNEDGSSRGPIGENILIKTQSVPEFSSNLHESQVAAKDVTYRSNDKVPDNGCTDLGTVSELNRAGTGLFNIQEDKDKKINNSNTLQMECVGRINMPTESCHDNNIEITEKVSEPHIVQEPLVSQICAAAVEENDLGGGATSTISISETSQGEADDNNNNAKKNIGAADISVDSCSRTDSLDAHWGSVSVLSMQSDVPTVIDAESTDSLAPENANVKKLKNESEEQSADKSDGFDPPSLLTFVENGTEIKADQNGQQSMQAGWFPSLTNVINESPGRKKNEEIIAKVTNWSSGKRHIPLKSLISETQPKSVNPKENPAQMVEKDDSSATDNGAKTTTVNSILGSESPAAQEQNEKQWSMAARYPSEIKGGKRKVKGRPIWAQFVCCSSVN